MSGALNMTEGGYPSDLRSNTFKFLYQPVEKEREINPGIHLTCKLTLAPLVFMLGGRSH